MHRADRDPAEAGADVADQRAVRRLSIAGGGDRFDVGKDPRADVEGAHHHFPDDRSTTSGATNVTAACALGNRCIARILPGQRWKSAGTWPSGLGSNPAVERVGVANSQALLISGNVAVPGPAPSPQQQYPRERLNDWDIALRAKPVIGGTANE